MKSLHPIKFYLLCKFYVRELVWIEHLDEALLEDSRTIPPSIIFYETVWIYECGVQKKEFHHFLLITCSVFSFLRDMEFWDDSAEKEEFKERAEHLTRFISS